MPTDAPPLLDPDGTPLADVLLDDSMGLRWAILTLRAPGATAAPYVLARFPGHRVVTEDDALVSALVAAGGTVARRGHDYEYDLALVPPAWGDEPAPEPYRLSQDLDPVALAPVHAAAVPEGHPDYEAGLDHVEDLRAMLAGELLGPNVPEATWQVSDDAGPAGAVIVSARPMRGGGTRAWVLDVFLDPRHQGRGLGRVLMRRALAGAARAGLPAMGLVVSDGNPARRLYESLGFTHLRSGSSIDVP
jgi:GNAT superfamily N-acetyltransferase